MKAKELSCKDLMIGDWVQGNPCGQHCDRNDNTYYKIAVLDIGNHCWGYSVCGAIVELKYDDIFPIPLIPEILEKNGFEKCEGNEFSFYKKEEERALYQVLWSAEELYLEIASYTSKTGEFNRMGVEFVHELQHALRLCGIDKEIEL